jgi:hypothetical protein
VTRLEDDRFSFEPVAHANADFSPAFEGQIMPADKAAAALALTRQISYRCDGCHFLERRHQGRARL